ncbi:Ethanolamine ammonia-lyase light chain [Spirosomataceae bacterium TFI 002]|nr:Ethanolamine ammonia-lyase light chain [Spirosomataceae bacterium TFI 002]
MNEEIDPWYKMKQFTNARISLGNVGSGMPLNEVLAFKLAHAKAKDAIFTALDIGLFRQKSKDLGLDLVEYKSQIVDRAQYLKRPDLGKKIAKEVRLSKNKKTQIVFVITDGLSASAVNKNAPKLLENILPSLTNKYQVSLALVELGRVAIGDPIAELYDADFVAVFIGERPGLSSPESMGIYTTYNPQIGFTDEKRNCISNIHKNGLQVTEAAKMLNYLIEESFRLKLSGVGLKLNLKALR